MMGYNLEDGAAKNIDETVVRQPLGVFACITPVQLPRHGAASGSGRTPIATGNTFVIKVSRSRRR